MSGQANMGGFGLSLTTTPSSPGSSVIGSPHGSCHPLSQLHAQATAQAAGTSPPAAQLHQHAASAGSSPPPQPQTPQQAQHSSPQQAQQQTSPLGLYGMSPSQSLSSQSLPSLGEQQPAGGRAQRTAGPLMGGTPVEGTPNWAA